MANKRKKNQKSRQNTQHDNGGGGGPSTYSTASNDGHYQTHYNKRPRYQGNNNGSEGIFSLDSTRHGYLDPHTGQRGAFPGLEEDDGEFYGPANDGMDYLKMVRSEAKGVPSLLIAGQQNFVTKSSPSTKREVPVAQIDELPWDDEEAPPPPEEKEVDTAGWYHDGTYTAAPLPTAASEAATLPPWHESLLKRFKSLRAAFVNNPPKPLALVSSSHKMWRQRQHWNAHAIGTKPTAGILAGLDQQMTLTLLEWLTALLRSGRGAGKGGFVGVSMKGYWAEWVWACLVRLDECLTADEIYVVRELGKKCLNIRKCMIGMREGWGQDGLHEDGNDDDDDDGEPGQDGEEPEDTKVTHVQEEPEEGECSSDPEPVSTVPAAATPASNPEEISLDEEASVPTPRPVETSLEKEVAHVSNPGEITLDGATNPANTAEDTIIYDPPIKMEEVPPSPSRSPKPSKEAAKEHSYADTMGALDMIISVVGGFFGQRDLLLEREAQGAPKCTF